MEDGTETLQLGRILLNLWHRRRRETGHEGLALPVPPRGSQRNSDRCSLDTARAHSHSMRDRARDRGKQGSISERVAEFEELHSLAMGVDSQR